MTPSYIDFSNGWGDFFKKFSLKRKQLVNSLENKGDFFASDTLSKQFFSSDLDFDKLIVRFVFLSLFISF